MVEAIVMLFDARKIAPFEHLKSHTFLGSGLEEFALPNGLRVLVHIDATAPVVSYFTWYRVGSRHEKVGKTGLAHLFEHLMFNETEGHKAGEFDRLLEASGAESNAATWFDWTYYYEAVPKDRLGLVIKLEAERMSKLVLRGPQVDSEKEVVANERRYRVDDDVEGIANEELYKLAFEKHAYHAPTIGWMQDIEGFTPEDCESFYRMYYAPNNATLVVVGDVRIPDLLKKIGEAYGPLTASVIPAEDIHPEPPQRVEKRMVLRKPTATAKVVIGYHGPAFGDANHPALTVLNEILFGGRASRAYEALVTNRELASDIRGWAATFKHPGLYEVYLTARPTVTASDMLAELERVLSNVTETLVSEGELSRAKARLELGLLQSLETMSGKAEQIGFYDTVLGDPTGSESRLFAYRQVRAEDIRFVARQVLRLENRTVIEVIPDGQSDASRPQLETNSVTDKGELGAEG